MIELLAIDVADLEFGLELSAVKEVIRPPQVVRVPNLPGFVAGVINFRGVAIPVIDLKTRFETGKPAGSKKEPPPPPDGESGSDAPSRSRMVICAVGSKVVAFAVDGASEIVRVAEEKILPPGDAALATVVAGVVPHQERLLVWLDAEGLLSSEEKLSIDSFRMRKEDFIPG
ncbi:MAG TPA: chemotaxis protein CheW [bacterium]|nr:chemotaxis protein CheW [bacterium]